MFVQSCTDDLQAIFFDKLNETFLITEVFFVFYSAPIQRLNSLYYLKFNVIFYVIR